MVALAEAQQSTHSALAAAVAERRFPDPALDFAAQILTRLDAPLRISVLGLPGSGKTGIFNLLAGTDVVPEGVNATLQLVHGDVDKSTATLRDGSSLTLEGPPDMARITSLAPVLITLEADLPALRKISLLEVVTSGERADQIRAIRWAMKQTDIAIWCSSDYDAKEQALWQAAPDKLKDHAILVRTRADLLGHRRDAVISELARDAESDFAYFLAVSTHEARAARADAGGLDKAAFKASGATALIGTILRQIERGRQNAVDQAEILLHKHRDAPPRPAPEPVAEPEPVVVPDPVPAAEVAEPAVAATVVAAPVEDMVPEAAPDTENAPIAAALTLPPIDLPIAEGVLSAEERHVLETALERLQKAGVLMADMGTDMPDDIISEALVALDGLSEFLYGDEMPTPVTPTIDMFRDLTQDAADLMQLLRIEGGADSALDAVSAMLQLKRGFQARLSG